MKVTHLATTVAGVVVAVGDCYGDQCESGLVVDAN